MRHILLYQDEDGIWIAECPSLPGCISDGETRSEAIANITEAIQGYIEVLREDGLTVPPENREILTLEI